MKRYARFLIPMTAALGGCGAFEAHRAGLGPPPGRDKPTPVRPVASGSPKANGNGSPSPGPGSEGPKRFAYLVRIKVVTIEVPVGTVSNSERIWNHLDEETLGEESLVNLGRNGFRIGVGPQKSWPAVAKVLTDLTGRSLGQTVLMAPPNQPVPYVVKQRQGAQTIFTFYPDRTCSGADYPPGDNLLTVVCTFDQDDPTKLMAVGVPQIRTTEHQPRILTQPGRVAIVEQPTLFTFDPLMFRLQFTGGDFLLIGPGRQASRAGSIGEHFLIKTRKGIRFETVLVLIPEVVAAPVPERPKLPLGATPVSPGGEDQEGSP